MELPIPWSAFGRCISGFSTEKFAIFRIWRFWRDLRISIQKNTFLLTSVFFILSQNEKKSKIAKKMAKQNIGRLSADNIGISVIRPSAEIPFGSTAILQKIWSGWILFDIFRYYHEKGGILQDFADSLIGRRPMHLRIFLQKNIFL